MKTSLKWAFILGFLGLRNLKKDAYLIRGTFSEYGSKNMHWIKIKRYSAVSMAARFEIVFYKIKCIQKDHKTPSNTIQHLLFVYI